MESGETLTSASFRQLAAARQEEILRAARAEFVAHGFALASTNTMVKNCGIAKGSLFNYFQDKESLFLYLHWLAGQRQLSALRMAGGTAGPPASAMDGLVRAAGLSLDLFSEFPDDFAFALTMVAPDAAHLVHRYIALFDPAESAALFRALVLPSGTNEALAQVLRWMLTGIKMEIQAVLAPATDSTTRQAALRHLRSSVLRNLELARGFIKE